MVNDLAPSCDLDIGEPNMHLSLKRAAQFPPREPRRALAIQAYVMLAEHDHMVPLVIKNVSENGFMGETSATANLKPGGAFGVWLGQLGIVRAIVCWNVGGEIGCQFRRPISLDRLERLAERAASCSTQAGKEFAVAPAALVKRAAGEAERPIAAFHIVSPHSQTRVELTRLAVSLGDSAQAFSEPSELARLRPERGIVIAEELSERTVAVTIKTLADAGILLPVVAISRDLDLQRVVAALRAGAVDYLEFPFTAAAWAARLPNIFAAAKIYRETHQRRQEARARIDLLSARESEVLELLSHGRSNQQIGAHLGISPRTAETHRSNLAAKLQVAHPIAAVRLWIEATQ